MPKVNANFFSGSLSLNVSDTSHRLLITGIPPCPRIQFDSVHISKYFWGFVCVLVAHTGLFRFTPIQISLTLFLYHLCLKMNNTGNSISESNIARSKAIFWPLSFSPGTHCLQLQSLLKANVLHSWEVGWWTVESYLQESCLMTVPSKGGEKALSWLPWV